jgi:hypothetical protein
VYKKKTLRTNHTLFFFCDIIYKKNNRVTISLKYNPHHFPLTFPSKLNREFCTPKKNNSLPPRVEKTQKVVKNSHWATTIIMVLWCSSEVVFYYVYCVQYSANHHRRVQAFLVIATPSYTRRVGWLASYSVPPHRAPPNTRTPSRHVGVDGIAITASPVSYPAMICLCCGTPNIV